MAHCSLCHNSLLGPQLSHGDLSHPGRSTASKLTQRSEYVGTFILCVPENRGDHLPEGSVSHREMIHTARFGYSRRAPAFQEVYCSTRFFTRSSTATKPAPMLSSDSQRNHQYITDQKMSSSLPGQYWHRTLLHHTLSYSRSPEIDLITRRQGHSRFVVAGNESSRVDTRGQQDRKHAECVGVRWRCGYGPHVQQPLLGGIVWYAGLRGLVFS